MRKPTTKETRRERLDKERIKRKAETTRVRLMDREVWLAKSQGLVNDPLVKHFGSLEATYDSLVAMLDQDVEDPQPNAPDVGITDLNRR